MQLFTNIKNLVSLEKADSEKQGRHIQTSDLSVVKNAAMLEHDGQVLWVGESSHLSTSLLKEKCGDQLAKEVDLEGKDVVPGFVECHTHLIFAGDRQKEFEMRNQGASYQQISAEGGGIASTVKATREASFEELLFLAQERLQRFIQQGVTTCEVKSGYGLSHLEELKMLKVASSLTGARVVRTYLGPHSKNPDCDIETYFSEILQKTLPQVAEQQLAERVDIFVEQGFYNLGQAKQYFQAAQDLGFQLTGHMEQLSNSGGALLAQDFQATSVDHVVELSDSDIATLAKSATVCVLLPGADFYLKMAYPRARAIIDAGGCVALATDFNPGTCPTQDISFIGVLARLEMRMSFAEVLVAYTLNAAKALGLGDSKGSLVKGKDCDFAVVDDYQSLFYQIGHHPVSAVYRRGHLQQ